jgi:phage terminase large subunit GpA-like protein
MNALMRVFRSGLKPDPRMGIEEWADTYRVLPTESSSEPGRYRTSRMPYLREIYKELSPMSKTQEVVVMKSTQVGMTEVGNNILFCYADLYPCPILQILHTETAVRTHAKDKIWASIRASERLRAKFRDIKSKDGSSTTKLVFNGGSVDIGWSNTTATFASMSRRIVINDDVDRWPDDVGGEGDPLGLSKKRTDAFPNRKIFTNSTPTTKENSKINKEYENSSMGLYNMKCPECGKYIVFEKKHFKFEHNETYELIDDVKFCCYECGSLISESEKISMMATENGAKWIHKHPHKEIRGFRLPAYYSPFFSWREIFRDYLIAYRLMKEQNDTRKMKVWTNTVDASTWEEKFDKVDTSRLKNNIEVYAAQVPQGVFMLTAGVDTQDDRLEVEVVGWGKYGESWSIDYHILDGDPKYPNVWQKLDNILQKSYSHESGLSLKILSSTIDTGGHRTGFVYEYCRPRFELGVFAIKGDTTIGTPIVKGRPSRDNKGKVPLYMIGVNSAKDIIHTQLMTREKGAGFMHFPKKPLYDESYFKQLTAEKRDEKGRWEKFRQRNEALDVRVYAMAALEIYQMQNFPDGFDWDEIENEFLMTVENFINYNHEEVIEDENNDFSNWRDDY